MAEYVVQAVGGRGVSIDRAAAITERLGERTSDQRSMGAAFSLLVAAKDRYPIARVQQHVCRHDEGFGDCKSAVIEG
jgi:hypothetical protein